MIKAWIVAAPVSLFALGVVMAPGVRARAAWVAQVEKTDYDSFMQQDLQGRLAAFNRLSAEGRADLVGTHIRRWIEANRTRLTPEQLEITQEWIAFAKADNYREPADKNPELMARIKDLEQRTSAVFTKEEMLEALTIRGSYIPKK